MDCIAHQAPLSMGFSRQEYWSRLSCPPPGNLPDSGMEAWLSKGLLSLGHLGSTVIRELLLLVSVVFATLLPTAVSRAPSLSQELEIWILCKSFSFLNVALLFLVC